MIDLFFDCETIPDQSDGALKKHLDNVKPPGNMKKQETIDKWIDEKGDAAALESWKKTALAGISGEICSIAWAFNDGPVFGVCHENEKPIIRTFFDSVHEQYDASMGKFPQIQWIGHNIIEFDLRFLWQRCVVRDIDPPCKMPLDKRHGQGVYDTMKAWCGWKGYEKQDNICDALGIEFDVPDTIAEIDGSMVWDMYQAGRFEEILTYNKLDVEKVRAMYRRMTWS